MAFFYAEPQQDQPAPPRRPGCRPGQDHPKALFSNQQVLAIKRRLAAGERVSAIAEDYAVPYQTIYGIKSGRTWRHLQLAP